MGQAARGLARRVGSSLGLGHWHPNAQCPKGQTTDSRLLSSLLIPPFSVAQEGFFCPTTLLNHA